MRNRLLVPTLGLGQMVAFASSYYLLGILADPMARTTGGQPAGLFAALSAAFLLSAVLTPFAGRAIERRGGRTVLASAHVAFAVALLVLCTARSPFQLWLGITLLGIGMGSGLYGTAFAILVELRGTEARRGITAVSLAEGSDDRSAGRCWMPEIGALPVAHGRWLTSCCTCPSPSSSCRADPRAATSPRKRRSRIVSCGTERCFSSPACSRGRGWSRPLWGRISRAFWRASA